MPVLSFARSAWTVAALSVLATATTAAPVPPTAAPVDPPSAKAPTPTPKTAATVDLDPVVVLGQSTPDPTQGSLASARATVADTPGGAAVVTPEALREGRAATVQDALGLAPGVYAQSRFGAQESRLSIRGSGLQRTFHLRGLNLLQDGVPLTLADGSGDFQSVDVQSVERIEIFRGANALRYGGATLGGSVNFVSPTGRTAPGLLFRGEAGAFGYRRLALQDGVSEGAWDAWGSVSRFAQDGYRRNARQREAALNTNVGWRGDGVSSRAYLSLSESDSDLPGNLTRAQFEADPRQAITNPATGVQGRDTRVLRLASHTVVALGNDAGAGASTAQLEVMPYYSQKRLDHPIFQVIRQDSDDFGVALRLAGRLGDAGAGAPGPGGLDHDWVVGFQPQVGRIDDNRYQNLRGVPGPRTEQFRDTASAYVLYAEDLLRPARLPRLGLVVGGQYVQARRRLQDLYSVGARGVDNSFSATWHRFSPKVGLLYDLGDGPERAQVFANVSGSFEPPSFGEIAGTGGVSNVVPQRGTTYEVGTRRQVGRVAWDVAAYRAELRNELLTRQLNDSPNAPGITTNAPRTIHQGVELASTVRLAPWLTYRLAATYNDFRYDGNDRYGDNRLPGIPRFAGREELVLERVGEGLYLGLTHQAASRLQVDMNQTTFAPGYGGIVGVKLGRRAVRGGADLDSLGWFVEGRNLADRRYVADASVVARAVANGTGAYYLPGEGRGVYAGVEWVP